MKNQKPVFEAMKNLVKVAVWGGESEYGTRYSISLSKLYKPKNGDSWKYSDSFDEVDSLSIPRVISRALDFIQDQKALKRIQEAS